MLTCWVAATRLASNALLNLRVFDIETSEQRESEENLGALLIISLKEE
jgi:hypothetical protein